MHTTIKYLFKDIQETEFELRDDGHGVYIEKWEYNKPKPTKKIIDKNKEKAGIWFKNKLLIEKAKKELDATNIYACLDTPQDLKTKYAEYRLGLWDIISLPTIPDEEELQEPVKPV